MEGNDSKKLTGIPKKDIFQAPAGYFDSLSERIAQKVDAEPKGKIVQFRYNTVAKIALAVAASVTLLIVVLPVLRNQGNEHYGVEEMLAEVTTQDCLAYLQSLNMETEEILAFGNAETLSEELGNEDLNTDLNDDEIDLLYERYGVTDDENMQAL